MLKVSLIITGQLRWLHGWRVFYIESFPYSSFIYEYPVMV